MKTVEIKKKIDDRSVSVTLNITVERIAKTNIVTSGSWLDKEGYDEVFAVSQGYATAHHKDRNQWDNVDFREEEIMRKNVGNPLDNNTLCMSEVFSETEWYKTYELQNEDVSIVRV